MARNLSLALKIRADTVNARRDVQKLRQELRATGQTGRRAGRDMRNFSSGIEGAQRTAANLRRVLVALGGIALFRTAIRNTVRQEQALAQVEARIQSTGAAAGFTTEQLAAMATELQNATTTGDEEILELQAQLLAFQNIAGDQFRRTTEVILDFAQVTGRNASSAVRTLAVAINDPINGMSRLRQAGISLSDSQQDVIRTMAESGDLIGAQRALLEALEGAYGGAARAARDTFGGSLTGLSNAFGDLFEATDKLDDAQESVEGLTSLLTDPDVVNGINRIVSGLVDAVGLLTQFATSDAAVVLLGGGLALAVGRLAGSIAGWVGRMRAAISEQIALTAANRAAAQQQMASAEATLLHAQRQVQLTTGMRRLTATQQILIPAQRAYDAALASSAATTGRLTAATGALRGAMAALGGPIGLVTTALTLGTTAWLLWGREADKAGERAEDAIRRANQAIEATREQQALAASGASATEQPLVASAIRLRDEYADTLDTIRDLENELEGLGTGLSLRRSGLLDELREARARATSLLSSIGDVSAELNNLRNPDGGDRPDADRDQLELLKQVKEEETEAIRSSIADQIQIYEDANRRIEEAQKRRLNIEQFFADARAKLNQATSEEEDLDVVDMAGIMAQARQALAAGDFERAIELSQDATEALQKLKEAGEFEGELGRQQSLGFLAQLERIALEAADAEQRAAESTRDRAQQVVAELLGRAQQLRNIEVDFDADAAQSNAEILRQQIQQRLNENPVVIPVTLQEDKDRDQADKKAGELLENLPARAEGGPIDGPGTETSDSILARVSKNEYVINAKAVRHYGEQFISSINQRRLPRFADGGLVGAIPSIPRPAPAIDSGTLDSLSGQADSRAPVHLHLDGREFEVQATPDVSDELQRTFGREALKRGRRRK